MNISWQVSKFKILHKSLTDITISNLLTQLLLLWLLQFIRLRLCHRFYLLLILYFVVVCIVNFFSYWKKKLRATVYLLEVKNPIRHWSIFHWYAVITNETSTTVWLLRKPDGTLSECAFFLCTLMAEKYPWSWSVEWQIPLGSWGNKKACSLCFKNPQQWQWLGLREAFSLSTVAISIPVYACVISHGGSFVCAHLSLSLSLFLSFSLFFSLSLSEYWFRNYEFRYYKITW